MSTRNQRQQQQQQQNEYLQQKSLEEQQREDYLGRVNVEPALGDIKNQDFKDLIYANFRTITNNDNITLFFKNIFNLLNEFNICFSSGTFIFEESNNCLFNYLTYGHLTLDSNTYNCENPENGAISKDSSVEHIMLPNTRRFGTTTHKNIYDKIPNCDKNSTNTPCYSSDICIPEEIFELDKFRNKSITNTKFQKVFDPPIDGICDTCKNPNRQEPYKPSEIKRTCLYYPFKVNTKNFPNFPPPKETGIYEHSFLFVKFESEPVSEDLISTENLKHVGNLVSARMGSKENYDNGIDTDRKLFLRREDKNDANKPDKNILGIKNKKQCDYNMYNKSSDVGFYNAIFGINNNYIDKIEWYDNNLRTGCEFFVTKELLEFFFIHFFNKEIVECENLENFFIETADETFNPIHNELLNAGSRKTKQSKKIKNKRKTRKNKRKTRKNKRKTRRNKRNKY
jgi:hypothetical protein